MTPGRFIGLALALLATLASIPSAALAEGEVDDIGLTLAVYDEDWNAVEGRPDLLIGHKFHLVYHVIHQGDRVPFTFRVTALPSDDLHWYWPALAGWGTRSDSRCVLTQERNGGVLSCPAESYLQVDIGMNGNAPGESVVSAEVVGSAPDPDTTNNAASWGTTVVCSITGTPGDDVLTGTRERDSICAGEGNDRLTAVGVDDELFGQEGDDTFRGSRPDTWGFAFGGSGFDTVSYENADYPILVCLREPRYAFNGSAWAPTGLVDIDRFVGSIYGDVMEGTDGANTLVGGRGRDKLIGLGGQDQLYGGRGGDKFITRDEQRDIIRGGRGEDRARVDRSDAVFSARRVATNPFVDPCEG